MRRPFDPGDDLEGMVSYDDRLTAAATGEGLAEFADGLRLVRLLTGENEF